MRVLVACEFSGVVREAFRRRGHDAWSCDLLPAEDGSQHHFQADALTVAEIEYPRPWDLMVAHPPCTFLAVSGARWMKDRPEKVEAGLQFVRDLMAAPIPRIAIENPISIISSRIRKPDQIIQPWQYGHGETKATCLWLKGLPKLTPEVHTGNAGCAGTHEWVENCVRALQPLNAPPHQSDRFLRRVRHINPVVFGHARRRRELLAVAIDTVPSLLPPNFRIRKKRLKKMICLLDPYKRGANRKALRVVVRSPHNNAVKLQPRRGIKRCCVLRDHPPIIPPFPALMLPPGESR